MNTTRLFPLFSALTLVTPGISSASDIIVGPTNKAGFQAIVDAADAGDAIVCLGGVYDFSDLGAVSITKSLDIQAADSDNPPIFVGLVDATTGGYVRIPGLTNLTGNTAFAVPGGVVIDGLEIDGLHFEGFERAIFTAVGFGIGPTGCWPITGGSLKGLELEDNHISNCYFGIQLLGGPLEKFDIKDNVIDCSTGALALNVQADYIPCPPPFINTPRTNKGEIKGNTLYGGPTPPMSQLIPAMAVSGAEKIQVKDNIVFAHPTSVAVLIRDDKAFNFGPFAGATPAFGDDGPIKSGQFKDNTLHDGLFGIVCQNSTTLEKVQIKGNRFVNSGLFDIYLSNSFAPPGFSGANGFEIKDNIFSGTAAVAAVYLAETTTNNVIKVPAGTNVIDLSAPGSNVIQYD